MNYEFPLIKNIEDVYPALAGPGATDFIVVKKDDYVVINYVITSSDTFPPVTDYKSAVRRECRGFIFDAETGNVLARRLHKFFNLGEHADCFPENIDWSKKHWVLEKLDGSMITPFISQGKIRWGTKMGLTDVSAQVEEFLKDKPWYTVYAESVLKTRMTPIFEWCSRSQRIVLDYPEDQLVLIAVRDNATGQYINYGTMARISSYDNIPVVNAWSMNASAGPLDVVKIVREAEDFEGVVIRFEDGHMVKVKSDWYVRLHRTKSMIESEKDVCNLILNNQLDDLIPVLMDVDKARVEKYRDELVEALDWVGSYVFGLLVMFNDYTRKDFALGPAPKLDGMIRAMVFTKWGENVTIEDCRKLVYDLVLKNTNSNKSFEKIKAYILKGIKYE